MISSASLIHTLWQHLRCLLCSPELLWYEQHSGDQSYTPYCISKHCATPMQHAGRGSGTLSRQTSLHICYLAIIVATYTPQAAGLIA